MVDKKVYIKENLKDWIQQFQLVPSTYTLLAKQEGGKQKENFINHFFKSDRDTMSIILKLMDNNSFNAFIKDSKEKIEAHDVNYALNARLVNNVILIEQQRRDSLDQKRSHELKTNPQLNPHYKDMLQELMNKQEELKQRQQANNPVTVTPPTPPATPQSKKSAKDFLAGLGEDKVKQYFQKSMIAELGNILSSKKPTNEKLADALDPLRTLVMKHQSQMTAGRFLDETEMRKLQENITDLVRILPDRKHKYLGLFKTNKNDWAIALSESLTNFLTKHKNLFAEKTPTPTKNGPG